MKKVFPFEEGIALSIVNQKDDSITKECKLNNSTATNQKDFEIGA